MWPAFADAQQKNYVAVTANCNIMLILLFAPYDFEHESLHRAGEGALRLVRIVAGLSGRLRLPARWPLVAALGLMLAACGVTRDQLDTVGAFGKSATKLADGVKAAYTQAAQNEVDLRLAQYIAYERGGPNDSPSQIIRSFRDPLFDLSKKRTKGRTAAATALDAYGKALSTLTDSKSQDSDFSTAVTSLIGAVKGVPSSVLSTAGITSSELDGLGKIVVVFGEFALDVRRRQVLEDVVPAAEPVVTKLCRMFGRDFDPNGRLVGTIVGTETQQTLADLENSMKKNGSQLQNRAILLPLYQKVTAIGASSNATFGALKEAADSCAKASVELAAAIKDPKYTLDDITNFVAKAQAAYDAVKAVAGSK